MYEEVKGYYLHTLAKETEEEKELKPVGEVASNSQQNKNH